MEQDILLPDQVYAELGYVTTKKYNFDNNMKQDHNNNNVENTNIYNLQKDAYIGNDDLYEKIETYVNPDFPAIPSTALYEGKNHLCP